MALVLTPATPDRHIFVANTTSFQRIAALALK